MIQYTRLWGGKTSKMSKMRSLDKVEKCGNYLPESVAAAVNFHLQNFLIAAAIKSIKSAFRFFLIAAAMGHRYENSTSPGEVQPEGDCLLI